MPPLKHDLIRHNIKHDHNLRIGSCPGVHEQRRGETKRKATEKFHLINSQKLLCRSSSNSKSVHGHQCIALPFIREQRVSELSQCPRSRESLTFLFQFHPSIYALCCARSLARLRRERATEPATTHFTACCCMLFALLCFAYFDLQGFPQLKL